MKFSVSMSVYHKDDPEHFRTALESVFEQTARPTEVVLVVDGPVGQEIASVIQQTQQRHESLKVIRLEQNKGHGEARRIGLENCGCELVAVMDSDDISVPDRFERQLRCFETDGDLSVVGGYIWEFEGDIHSITGVRKVPIEDHEIKAYLKSRCPFNQMTVMFRKSHVHRAGGYLDWHHEEDYFLWIRMFLTGCKFQNIPENLVYARMSTDSYVRRGGLRYFKSEAALQVFMYQKKIISLPRLVSNIVIRFIVQVLLPNRLRRWMFVNLFRAKRSKNG